MPEVVNTSFLGSNIDDVKNPSEEIMVKVENVSMVFNMAGETMNNLKEYAIALAKRQLHFKEFRALDDISLEVRKGDVFGILGTNGSGKSTLLKIIAGVLEPSEGTCAVSGNIAPLIELGAGFDMELTARENIYLNGALLGYSRQFIEDHFEEIVDFAEIEEFLDMPLKNYSSGMVARIAFAIATVIVPDILIVDEVLSVGDFMFQEKCEKRIDSLIKEYGVTVLIVSHDNYLIERLCNKAIWIEKGHTRILGAAEDVCRIYQALGGLSGDSKSEQRVFDILKDSGEIPDGVIFTIAGEDQYETALRLMEHANFSDSENAIVVNDSDIAACMIAANLSGFLDAPVLYTKAAELPELTLYALKIVKPHRIIVLAGRRSIEDCAIQTLYKRCEGAEILCIEGETPAQLAINAQKLCIETASTPKTIAYASTDCMQEYVSASPYLVEHKIPVFLYEKEELGCTLDQVANNCETVLLLGDRKHIPEEFRDNFESKANVIRLSGETPHEANDVIHNWFTAMDHCPHPRHVVVSNERDIFDAIASGPFVARTHASYLFVDPTNIDSINHALDIIQERSGQIEKLTFLGGRFVFREHDKELISKAVFQTRNSSCLYLKDCNAL